MVSPILEKTLSSSERLNALLIATENKLGKHFPGNVIFQIAAQDFRLQLVVVDKTLKYRQSIEIVERHAEIFDLQRLQFHVRLIGTVLDFEEGDCHPVPTIASPGKRHDDDDHLYDDEELLAGQAGSALISSKKHRLMLNSGRSTESMRRPYWAGAQ